MIRSLILFVALAALPYPLFAESKWPATGKYEFTGWTGPRLAVYYSVPPKATAKSPILIIIPGVKRNAEEYRNEWDHLATANGFITLVVDRAVAANPAFFMMPDNEKVFPFGMKGAPLANDALRNWFDKRLVLLLGEQDREPRTQLLSNGPEARLQGPHVLARGLGFYRAALSAAAAQHLDLRWHLEIIPGVGHSDPHVASYAVKYLFPDRDGL